MQVVLSYHLPMALPSGPTDARHVAPGVGIVTRADGLRHLSQESAGAFLGLVRAGEVLDRQLNAELETAHGIGLRGFEVLLFLAVFAPEGQLRMSELTEQAPLSQSRVSRLVAQLEAAGLVERSPDPADGRGVEVSITAKGLATFKSAQDTHLAGLDHRLFSRLTATEVRQLRAITSKILDGCGIPPPK